MTQILQFVQNFKKFKIYLYFVSQPDIRYTSGKRVAPEITHNKSKLSFFFHKAWTLHKSVNNVRDQMTLPMSIVHVILRDYESIYSHEENTRSVQ